MTPPAPMVAALCGLVALAACAAPIEPVAPAPEPVVLALEPEPTPAERCAAAQPPPVAGDATTRDVIPLRRLPADYPARALARGITGSCRVTFDILATGAVDAATAKADCTAPEFVEAATRAVGRWCYLPALRDGVAVDVVGVQAEMNFAFAE